ncbi:DgyrCDS8457 [Dimorphilus gyrociliatus]|uniref:DgyrCDS8457 n=1 Tax=Dimorphilus gyrociliatus TaxID=2664684 RepID=A0A7I8VZC3_9ANNE|nr:DgyrCDS8457 [Dimorphilus gyrociliatus]
MFGHNLFGSFEGDPFFMDHRDHVRMMNDMMSRHFQPFGQQLSLENSRPNNQRQMAMRTHDPFSMFNHMNSFMGNFHSMFDEVNRQMRDPSRGGGGAVYQQSTVMTYSNDGSGAAPKVFQATSSTRTGPGGVKETRKSVRDSSRGVEKMAIGHHIGDRAHIIERKKNTKTGDMEENKDLINLDEDEAPDFEREFREKAHGSSSRHHHSVRTGRYGHPALEYTPYKRN